MRTLFLALCYLLSIALLRPDLSLASVPKPKEDRDDPVRRALKENYTLFDQVPLQHLRDFHPDRPGSTNTPYTVDAGHFQLELEAVNYSHLNSGNGNSNQYNFPNPNLRIGLTHSFEISLAWVPFMNQAGTNGMGDLNIRLKKNILGNDGGPFAWGWMPGVKIPTHSQGLGNPKWEPYLMIPFTVTLPDKWAVSLMPEIDLRKNSDNSSFHTEFISPLTFGHHLFSTFDGYIEFVSHSTNEKGAPWQNYFGLGSAIRTSASTQVDFGINLGLNSTTPQSNPFAGWVVRL